MFSDGNENVQVVNDSQNAFIGIAGDENEVCIDQPPSQSGFSPEVSTDCTRFAAQAFSGWFLFF